jgi:hypothetical protein
VAVCGGRAAHAADLRAGNLPILFHPHFKVERQPITFDGGRILAAQRPEGTTNSSHTYEVLS